MRDRVAMLEKACAALTDGDAATCDNILQKFRTSVERQPLDDGEYSGCEQQLERLRHLATAACEGIDVARAWLAELAQTTGGLDVYDRGGRQRVTTELSGVPHRF